MSIMSRRVPCYAQGNPASDNITYPDENTPCMICSGDVISKRGETHVCPFTKSPKNNRFTTFRGSADLRYITATERFFEMQQRKKIETADHGFMTCEV